MQTATLSLTQRQHAELTAHLFPADGCEAVAIALCGRRRGAELHRLLVQRLAPVPYEACSEKKPDRVTWPTDMLPPLLEEARQHGLAILKIHGHGHPSPFSAIDDHADRALFPSVHAWTEDGPHASAVMFRDGRMIGRLVDEDGRFHPLTSVNVVGDDLSFWTAGPPTSAVPEFGRRVAQSFGSGTFDRLRSLRVGVVGCSGTGSPLIEQLARNCVGTLVLVDPDRVEEKNLNRILTPPWTTPAESASRSTSRPAPSRKWAWERQWRPIPETSSIRTLSGGRRMRRGVRVHGLDRHGRHLLNKLATFYLIPYFDLGVKLEADGKGGVDQVCGTVHYLQPGGSSLLSRHVYTMEQVRAAGLFRTDPAAYRTQLEDGYIRGVQEDRPAVVQLNSLVASLAVNEFLARLHPYRLDPNADYAIHRLSVSHGIYEHEQDGEPCPMLARHVGRGDVTPLLDWPELSLQQDAA